MPASPSSISRTVIPAGTLGGGGPITSRNRRPRRAVRHRASRRSAVDAAITIQPISASQTPPKAP